MPASSTSLAGARAVVTGAGRGIGRAHALALAQAGATVVVNYSRSADAANEVVEQITAGGGHAYAIAADLTDPTAITALMNRAAELMGGIDILISNAGIDHFGDLGSVTAEEFDTVFALNTRAQFLAVHAAQKHMGEGGRIVCTSSISAREPVPRHALYAGSKGAVESMVACLALDLAPRKITINAVAPGGVASDMSKEMAHNYRSDFVMQGMPMGRLAEPIDIAAVVRFLSSPDSGWITGQTIVISGGGG